MFTFFLMIHILICFLLVVVILLQAGKGGGLASAFGGAGTTDATFGGRQAAGFLGKSTTVLGTLFLVSSFFLALLSSYNTGPSSAVQQELQSAPAPLGAPAPLAEPSNLFQEETAPDEGQP
ncbi:MAG: preprotein translocase subunit SecG [Candidatus Glassbacteria bacterium]|nr:preprotein translocase subunit SecG [Candidatus Glassbacteria bacterium]